MIIIILKKLNRNKSRISFFNEIVLEIKFKLLPFELKYRFRFDLPLY